MNNFSPSQLITSAEEIIAEYRKLPSNPNPEKQGGYLTVGFDSMSVTHVLEVGTYPSEKLEKYKRLSLEKATRLHQHWLGDLNSVSSYQSRNPSNNLWGGAVLFDTRVPSEIQGDTRATCDIVSFSGLPELGDEAVSFVLGYRLGLGFGYNDKLAERIIKISHNLSLRELLDKFRK